MTPGRSLEARDRALMGLQILREFVRPVVARDEIEIRRVDGRKDRPERVFSWIGYGPGGKPRSCICVVWRVDPQVRLSDIAIILARELECIDDGGIACQRH